MSRALRFHTARGLAALIGGLLLSTSAFAQLPVLQPEQHLRLPPDPAPQEPEDLPVYFGQRIYTDGDTAIVTVDEGHAAYAYVKNGNGKWVYQDALVVPAGYASTGAAIHNNVALVEGLVDSVGVTYVFYRTNGQWSLTQTLPGSGQPNTFQAYVAVGDNYLAIGQPNFDGYKGGIAIYDAVGAGTYNYNTTLQTAGAGEGYLTGVDTQIDGDTVAAFTPEIGAVSVFVRTGGVWSQQALLTRTDGFQLRSFALDNRRIVLVAEGHIQGQANNPQVFVRHSGNWSLEQELVHPSDPVTPLAPVLGFSGKRILVGDSISNTAFLYERGPSGWNPVAELPKVKPQTCSLDGDGVRYTRFALSGRTAFAACASKVTADPRFDGRVLVYRLPAID